MGFMFVVRMWGGGGRALSREPEIIPRLNETKETAPCVSTVYKNRESGMRYSATAGNPSAESAATASMQEPHWNLFSDGQASLGKGHTKNRDARAKPSSRLLTTTSRIKNHEIEGPRTTLKAQSKSLRIPSLSKTGETKRFLR